MNRDESKVGNSIRNASRVGDFDPLIENKLPKHADSRSVEIENTCLVDKGCRLYDVNEYVNEYTPPSFISNHVATSCSTNFVPYGDVVVKKVRKKVFLPFPSSYG